MPCIRCGSEATRKDGQTRLGGQRWRCNACGRRFTTRSTSAFSGHGFPEDVIALAIRWYVRYWLSYADVVAWFAERGLGVHRSTIYRWVQRLLPLFGEAARAHRRPVGDKWRVDELDVRFHGHWTWFCCMYMGIRNTNVPTRGQHRARSSTGASEIASTNRDQAAATRKHRGTVAVSVEQPVRRCWIRA